MIPSNFIPPGPAARLKQQHYTDGTPSQEVEDEWEDESEDTKQFKQGFAYKKPSVIDLRDDIGNVMELISVCANALMAESPFLDAAKVHGVLMIQVNNKLREIEGALARL